MTERVTGLILSLNVFFCYVLVFDKVRNVTDTSHDEDGNLYCFQFQTIISSDIGTTKFMSGN